MSSKELENRVTHSVTNMLQGSVAGLNITTSSGKPGSTPSINIRGVNSVNSADPLVLIDGVVGDLNRVNPNTRRVDFGHQGRIGRRPSTAPAPLASSS